MTKSVWDIQTPKSPRGWVEVNTYTIFLMKSPRNIFLLLHFMYITTLSTLKLTLLLAEVFFKIKLKTRLCRLESNTLQRQSSKYI